MGSFGALYYATPIRTSCGCSRKPLLNIGTIADNMKLLRPNEFGTANDVLLANTGGISTSDVQHLDSRFWEKLKTVI